MKTVNSVLALEQSEVPSAKPAMPDFLKEASVEARKRVDRRPKNPGVRLGDANSEFSAPHTSEDDWRYQIRDAFGTHSPNVAEFFLSQLTELFLREQINGEPERSQRLLNAALAIVNGVRPRTEIEACLAAQMVGIHVMMMRLSARALIPHETDPASVVLASKLARTFAQQAEALRNLRRPRAPKQSFKIERHDHHYQHVHVEGRGVNHSEDQPHAPTACQRPSRGSSRSAAPRRSPPKLASCTPMSSEDSPRNRVPCSGDEG